MNEEDKDQSNIIEADFSKRRGEMSVEYLPSDRAWQRKYNGCQHQHIYLDADNHCLECKDCGQHVDPIKYLERWAKRERQIDYRVEMIKRFEKRQAAERERERRKHMPRSEWKKDINDIIREHRDKGCPREYMWFTKNTTHCYCGSGWSRLSFPQLEAEVRAARKAAEQRKKMRVVDDEARTA